MTLIEFMKAQNDEGAFLTLKLTPLREKGWRYSLYEGIAIFRYNGEKLTVTADGIPAVKQALEDLIQEVTRDEA